MEYLCISDELTNESDQLSTKRYHYTSIMHTKYGVDEFPLFQHIQGHVIYFVIIDTILEGTFCMECCYVVGVQCRGRLYNRMEYGYVVAIESWTLNNIVHNLSRNIQIYDTLLTVYRMMFGGGTFSNSDIHVWKSVFRCKGETRVQRSSMK